MSGPATPQRRKVRFSLQDDAVKDEESSSEESLLFRSPPPPTPSPTHSVSTDSSGGPPTPPSPGFMVLESKGSFSPPHSKIVPRLHPSLASGVLLSWDMAKNPDDLVGLTNDTDDVAASLHPKPGLRRLMLTHDAIPQWPLYIEAERNQRFLSVQKVFRALYEHLKKPTSRGDFDGLSQDAQKVVLSAYRARRNEPSGVLRIDYLPGRIFHGLRLKGKASDDDYGDDDCVWEFRFDVG